MRLTFVQSETDNSTADHADHAWSEVAQFLTTHRRLPAKGQLGIIFARFVDGPCRRKARAGACTKHCPGNDHRIDENVEAVTALGLDFDDAPAARLTGLITALVARGLRFVFYTTWSHTPDHPKIRVVIALDAEVPRDLYKGFWDAVTHALGIADIVDTSCRNPGRLFFTPQCPEGASPSAQAYEGAPLATADILSRVTPDTTVVSESEHTDYPPATPALLDHALTRLKAHGPAIEGRGGNAHTRAAWGILVNDLALSDAEARAVFRLWDLGNQPPWGETAFAGPARSDQTWSGPRGAERDRYEASIARVDIFGDTPPAPAHPSVLADEPDHTEQAPIRRYSTGISGLDTKLGGGISTRQATVIMAPPADGKSALAVSIAIHTQSVVPVLYASTELETHELRARLAAPRIGCAWRDIVDGHIDQSRVTAALKGLRIHLLGCERLPMGEAALTSIEAEIQRLTAEYKTPPMVVIDYLQDLARGVDERGVRAKIGGLATMCRAMSQRLDCVMLVISSVSRAYYGSKRAAELREVNEATAYLAAAKESGDVDYAAAAVIFLDVVGASGTGYRAARLAVAKSRHGETGFVGARFVGATGEWREAPDEVVEAAGKREAAQRAAEHEQTDLRVLQAVRDAAREHAFYTPKAWRSRAADGLVGGLSDNAVREALARLVEAGKLGHQQQHPEHPGKAAPGGGVYIVARSV